MFVSRKINDGTDVLYTIETDCEELQSVKTSYSSLKGLRRSSEGRKNKIAPNEITSLSIKAGIKAPRFPMTKWILACTQLKRDYKDSIDDDETHNRFGTQHTIQNRCVGYLVEAHHCL